MQQCPYCNNFYDESEYSKCPYCSGDLERDTNGTKIKSCPECGGIMYWYGCWECSNCDCTIDTDEEDYDSILDD